MDLAQHYGMPASALILGTNPTSVHVKFRANGSPKEVVLEVIGRQHDALIDLLELLGELPQPKLSRLEYGQPPHDARSHGELAAQAFRTMAGISEPPSDLHELLEGFGFIVLEAPLPKEVSGLYLRGRRGEVSLLIQPEEVDGRQRFSLAHELGHALLDSETAIVSEHGSTTATEVRANSFAGELLLPTVELKKHCVKIGKTADQLDFIDVAKLAAEFHLTYAATAYRLFQGGAITQAQYDVLMAKQRNANGFRSSRLKEAPLTAHRQSIDGIGFLKARKALAQGLVTSAKFREYGALFGVPPEVVATYMEE